ncbi:MAG TPA: hypothetical protein PKN86_04185 [Candidatus Obscuribacter sp.]|nr:hypothetical protein [Candidatus Obscuribacter sp.]
MNNADNASTPLKTATFDNIWITKVAPFFLLVSLAALVLHRTVFWLMHPLLVSADQSVYLAMAELILKGKVPYRDFFDFNPPLIMYLNTIPISVAHLFHIPTPLGLSLTVSFIHAVASGYIASLLFRFRQYLPAAAMLPVLFVFAAFTTFLDQDMGQREHLFTLLFFPFFIVRGLRHFGAPVGKRERILWSLLCGTILCLKPHFVFIYLMAEAGLWLESRNTSCFFNIEILTMCIPALVYAICFMFLPQEARSLFFDQILPVYIWGNGWAAKCFTYMLVGYDYFAVPFYQATAALIIALVMRNKSRWIPAFLFITIAAMLCYIQGGQAWTYRLLPMAFFAKLLLAFEVGLLGAAVYHKAILLWTGFRLVAAASLLCLTLHYCLGRDLEFLEEYRSAPKFDLTSVGFEGQTPRSDLDVTFFSMVENSNLGDGVVHIGSGIHPGYPCQLQSCRKPASRYLYFMITLIHAAMEKKPELMEKWRDTERIVVENLGNDIIKNRPILVYLQDYPVADALEKFHFSERYLKNYSLIGQVDVTKIYKRTGSRIDMSAFTPKKRAEIVLPLLCEVKTIEQVSRETTLPPEVLIDWTARAKKAMVDKLKDRGTDREDELRTEITRLSDELWKKSMEADRLRERVKKLENFTE